MNVIVLGIPPTPKERTNAEAECPNNMSWIVAVKTFRWES